jgi:hypothetical protein
MVTVASSMAAARFVSNALRKSCRMSLCSLKRARKASTRSAPRCGGTRSGAGSNALPRAECKRSGPSPPCPAPWRPRPGAAPLEDVPTVALRPVTVGSSRALELETPASWSTTRTGGCGLGEVLPEGTECAAAAAGPGTGTAPAACQPGWASTAGLAATAGAGIRGLSGRETRGTGAVGAGGAGTGDPVGFGRVGDAGACSFSAGGFGSGSGAGRISALGVSAGVQTLSCVGNCKSNRRADELGLASGGPASPAAGPVAASRCCSVSIEVPVSEDWSLGGSPAAGMLSDAEAGSLATGASVTAVPLSAAGPSSWSSMCCACELGCAMGQPPAVQSARGLWL